MHGTRRLGGRGHVPVTREERWRLAAAVVRRFAAGELTNDEFEAAYEDNAGDDRVLFEVGKTIWRFYDDLSEHRLEGRHALSPGGAALFDRCALFLETQDHYRWPVSQTVPERLTRFWDRLRGAPRSDPDSAQDAPVEGGEPEVWPFYRRSEWERANQRWAARG